MRNNLSEQMSWEALASSAWERNRLEYFDALAEYERAVEHELALRQPQSEEEWVAFRAVRDRLYEAFCLKAAVANVRLGKLRLFVRRQRAAQA